MASWSDVIDAITEKCNQGMQETAALDSLREEYVSELCKLRERSVICYYSAWLQNPQGANLLAIDDDDMNGFMNAVHMLDKSRGLDLMLHTPGGNLAATESIVHYLMDYFDRDVCAIVPHLAMSAGTMMACACRRVIMGRQSSLGPVDPQLRGLAVGGVIEEFNRAVEAAKTDPDSIPIWAQIISQYSPTFLGDCQKALDASRLIVHDWLLENMLRDEDGAEEIATRIVTNLCDHEASAMHDRHFSYSSLRRFGMHIDLMESDNALQDAVLSVHHAFMATFQRGNAVKIIQSSNGKLWMVGPAG